MAELKTKENDGNIDVFLQAVADPQQRADCLTLLGLLREWTSIEPRMWGPSIVGFGHYHYKYDSGREGDRFPIGFSPRKASLTLYFATGFEPHGDLLSQLGKHKTGKSCLYIKTLADVDREALRRLVLASLAHVKAIEKQMGNAGI